MTNELSLQNAISLQEQQKIRKRLAAKKDVDYSQYQLGVTTLPSRGHLVRNPVWKAPVVAVEDTFQNVKNISKGLKGEGNDHSLGLTNDVAMKASGLAIAGYLATKRALPVQKGMELVGFASFLTSMALWPKLFIQAPIQAINGFNVNQQYVDSQGRKKPFHIDPQYTPWSLYDGQEIDAIGDKMGIRQDMENRRGLVQEKMTKIATQANTLWMLTAGVAVPTMGALISSQAEKGLNMLHQHEASKAQNKKMTNLSKQVEEMAKKSPVAAKDIKDHDKKGFEALDKLLQENQDKQVNEKFINTVVDMVSADHTKVKQDFKNDLMDFLRISEVSNVAEHLEDIKVEIPLAESTSAQVAQAGAKAEPKTFMIELKKEQIAEALQKAKLNEKITLAGKADELSTDAQQIKLVVQDLFMAQLKAKGEAAAKAGQIPAVGTGKFKQILKDARADFNSKITARLQKPSMVLTAGKRDAIAESFKAFSSFSKKAQVLQEYVGNKVALKQDSVAAREWTKAISKIFKALDFNSKDYAEASKSTQAADVVLRKKCQDLSKESNKAKYEAAAGQIHDAISEYLKNVNEGVGGKSFVATVTEAARVTHETLGSQLAGIGGDKSIFARTADRISSHHEAPALAQRLKERVEKQHSGSLKNSNTKASVEALAIEAYENSIKASKEKAFTGSVGHNIVVAAQNEVVGAEASLYKILHGLDLAKRIETGVIKKALMDGEGFGKIQRTSEYADQVIGVMQNTLSNVDLGLHSVKCEVPNKEVYIDAMTFLYGADQNHLSPEMKEAFRKSVKHEFEEKAKEKNGELAYPDAQKIDTETARQIDDYKAKLPKQIELAESTKTALSSKGKGEDLRAFLVRMSDQTLNKEYDFKMKHMVLNNGNVSKKIQTTTIELYKKVGGKLSELTRSTAEQVHNTRTWFKIWGGIGAGVAAVTLVAPIFFGKVKEPQSVKKEVSANG